MKHEVSIALAASLWASLATLAYAEPRLQDVLSAVTVSFGDDGAMDRVLLTQNSDAGADLSIYHAVTEPKDGEAPAKPAFVKKNVAFAGTMWGTLPSLGVNPKGSLVITSTNTGVGRVRWTQTMTVVQRNGDFVIAGLTYASFDDLDPKSAGSCDLNLLAGKGTRNGKPVGEKLPALKLADWADEKLPKACQF